MGIDMESKPNFIWIQISDTPEHLKSLRKTANEELTIKEDGKQLLILDNSHGFEPVEYYFNENFNKPPSIYISGSLKSASGDCHISLDMPLSDTVLIDIIHHAIKKLNKLKTAMETLK